MSEQVKHWRVTYNEIHNLIRKCTPSIAAQYNPDLLIAIGGGSAFDHLLIIVCFLTTINPEAFSLPELW